MYRSNPPPTNNPFIEIHPNPAMRYPDITAPPTQPPSQWTDPTSSIGVQQQYLPDNYQQYSQTQQPQFPPGYTQQQQPQSHHPQNYPSPYPQSGSQGPQPPTSFQPSSSFGQHTQAAISGSSYGHLQGQHQLPPQQTRYNPGVENLQNNPSYPIQFDSYAPISWAANPSQSQNPTLTPSASTINNHNSGLGYRSPGNQNPINSGPPSIGSSPSGDPHPRDYIRSHKQELEAWDSYTWKQLFNSCEVLEKAWETKKNDLKEKVAVLQAQRLRYAGYYDPVQIQQEHVRMQGFYQDAQSNFDSVSASRYQLDEVFKGYHQSRDPLSKRRVREATNAALQKLPNWP